MDKLERGEKEDEGEEHFLLFTMRTYWESG